MSGIPQLRPALHALIGPVATIVGARESVARILPLQARMPIPCGQHACPSWLRLRER